MNNELLEVIKSSDICDDLKKFFESDRRKALFGAGQQARVCYDVLTQCNLKTDYLIFESSPSRMSLFPKESELPFYHVSNIPEDKRGHDILIAVNESHNKKIKDSLNKNGLSHVYCADFWGKSNRLLRIALFNDYLSKRGVVNYEKGAILEYGNFKIANHFGRPEQYSTMLMGEFNDIIAPSIFNDYSCVTEGAYEWGKVVLEKGDIVLDLGANIGMFSCVAASKGCEVYAFEPTPDTIELLKMNADICHEIRICPYAVAEKRGVIEFYVNPMSGSDVNTGMNSFVRRQDGFRNIEVSTISIDEFVEENNLKSVDFIKADIEGAERDMLMGAKRTLKQFAPKLSLCTYHLPDDPQVMEQLILEANPDYVIEHRWCKLFAHVPSR